MILKVNGGNGVWISINGGDKSFASGGPGGVFKDSTWKCTYCRENDGWSFYEVWGR